MKRLLKKTFSVMFFIAVLIFSLSFSVFASSTFTFDFDIYSNHYSEVYPETSESISNTTPVDNYLGDGVYRMAIYPADWNSNINYVGGINCNLNFDLFNGESGRSPYILHDGNQYKFLFDLEFFYKYDNSQGWVNVPHGGSFVTIVVTFASNWESDTDYKFYYLSVPFDKLYDQATYSDFSFVVDGADYDGYAINLVELQWHLNETVQALETHWEKFVIDRLSTDEVVANQIQGEIVQSREEINKKISESTDKINNKIEESTDKITNGWEPDPVSPEGSDVVDDYISAEEELMEGQQEGIDNASSLFTGFSTQLFNFNDGMRFVGKFFTSAINSNGWLSNILGVLMTMGILGWLLNMTGAISGFISRFKGKGKG